MISHAWTSLKRDDGGFKRSAHSAVPTLVFRGLRGQIRAKIEPKLSSEAKCEPKMRPKCRQKSQVGHQEAKIEPNMAQMWPQWAPKSGPEASETIDGVASGLLFRGLGLPKGLKIL